MIGLLITMMICCSSYFETYQKESNYALDFTSKHKMEIKNLKKYLSDEEARLAMCIVAPELSQFCRFADQAETFALYTLYVQGHMSNFSIGYFQMKPSFATDIENKVASFSNLAKYKKLVINEGGSRADRYKRVERLSSLEWQLLYLSAFVDIIKNETSNLVFQTTEDKLRYWATLYNAGLNLNKKQVLMLYDINGFPNRSADSFNYAEICVEFYHNMAYCTYLY